MAEEIVVLIDDEDIIGLIPSYLERCRGELAFLEAAATQGDFEALRQRGHKLKGSGGGFGLLRISELGAALESAAIAKDATQVKDHILALSDFLVRVKIMAA